MARSTSISNGTTDQPVDVFQAQKDALVKAAAEISERIAPAKAAIAEDEENLRRLERAIASLDGDFRAPTAQPSRPRPVSSGTGSRAPRGQNKAKILAVVRDRPGVSAGEVANVTSLDSATVATSLSKLAQGGDVERVTTEGSNRVTFKITDQGKATLADLEAKLTLA